jgi:hypothetical protein
MNTGRRSGALFRVRAGDRMLDAIPPAGFMFIKNPAKIVVFQGHSHEALVPVRRIVIVKHDFRNDVDDSVECLVRSVS